MYDTRVLVIGAAGTGAKAWVLPGSHQIAGIKVDNKSGSWLALPDGAFVPPYTIGWGHSFEPTLASIDILFSTGPAAQVSTNQGDNPVITIYSDPVGESPGIPSGAGNSFITQFTPNQLAFSTIVVPYSNGNDGSVLPAINGKRYRLLTAFVALQPFFSNPPINWDTGLTYDLYLATTTTDLATGKLNTAHPNNNHLWPLGADCPVGGTNAFGVGSVRFFAAADFCDTSVSLTLTFQVI